jgi:hypothetical protein
VIDEAQIQALIDKDAIRDVINGYARGIDRGDLDLRRKAYHPDATQDFGKNTGSGSIEDHLAAGSTMHEYVGISHHHIANILIELDGDFATAESYVIDTLTQKMDASRLAEGQQVVHQLFARYLDRLEKRNGEWRIIRRVVVKDLRDVRTSVDFNDGYRPGATDTSDVVYDPMRR